MKRSKQILALFLCGAMLSLQTTVPVRADELAVQESLCEHHTVHTPECGYVPADPGSPCTHVHGSDCYSLMTDCVHVHTDECYSGSETDPDATPSDADRKEPVSCPHTCSEESGCIEKKLDCSHIHDDVCGYQPKTEGSPCTFVCDICNSEDLPDGVTPPAEEKQCTCSTLCTADAVDSDCEVCGGENGDLTACEGAVPEEMTPYALSAKDPMNVYTYSQYDNLNTAGDGSEWNPYNRFEDAVANVADGGTIYIKNNGFINVKDDNGTFVINKKVTIKPAPGQNSAKLLVRSAGIALGADVTIENIELSLSNKARAAIFANGHELTLSNVTRGSGGQKNSSVWRRSQKDWKVLQVRMVSLQ